MVTGISPQTVINTVQTIALACWEAVKRIAEIIVEIVKEAFECIYEFFASLDIERSIDDFFNSVCCLDAEDQDEIDQEEDDPIWSIRVNHSGDVPYALNACDLNNGRVDLDELQRVLTARGGRAQVSRQMTIADFSALSKRYPVHYRIVNRAREVVHEGDVDHIHLASDLLYQRKQEIIQRAQDPEEGRREAAQLNLEIVYPWERKAIGKWATRWAEDRQLTFDPNSKFAPVIREAFRLKDQIPGGRGSSEDPMTYHPRDPNYYSNRDMNVFTYVIYTLLGFQELDRPQTVELFYLLDDLSQSSSDNSAYAFASGMSRIFTYPNAGGNDIRHKLQLGCGAAWAAWELARQQNCALELFTRGPGLLGDGWLFQNCFDARVSTLQQFVQRKSQALFDLDFAFKCNYGDRIEVKVGAHVDAFRNVQIRDYEIEHLRNFPGSRFTYPILKETFGMAGLDQDQRYPRIGGAPHPTKPDETCQSDFRLPLERIPAQHRQVGTVLTLQNPFDRQWYQVEVVEVGPENIRLINHVSAIQENWYNQDRFAAYLEINGQPLRQIALASPEHPRVDNYDVRFDKTRCTLEVAQHRIPQEYRRVDQVISILCPQDRQWYQARVAATEPRVRLDLSGLPLPRQRWEAIIEQLVLM